jgi:hypothetical protein
MPPERTAMVMNWTAVLIELTIFPLRNYFGCCQEAVVFSTPTDQTKGAFRRAVRSDDRLIEFCSFFHADTGKRHGL